MKLFVILSRFPYPLDKGDKLRAYYQIKDLAASHDVYLHCLTDKAPSKEDQEQLAKICKEVQTYELSKTSQTLRAGLALFSRHPFQVKMFHSASIHRGINKAIDRIQPDHIYCQLVRVAEYVKRRHDIPSTIDYMDALSTGMQRMAGESSAFKRWLYATEGRRLTKYENLIFDYFDNHVIISSQDRELIYHPDRKKIHVIPNGVDLDRLTPIATDKRYDIVFHGNMNYPPNVKSALYIKQGILPAAKKAGLELKALISGVDPHPRVLEQQDDQFTVSGWVQDIRESYCSAHIFVAPMLINTGMQNKILEAMSLEIPCVTTSQANNAIGAEPDQEIVIADSAEEFAEKIQYLLDNPEARAQLAQRAKAFIRDQYSWHANNLRLQSIFFD